MAKAIMVQGTMSNCGKSFFTAALCRIFHQDGYRVAPFKSQNMALNSFITKEGFEMGRAQVMQAEAAGVEPSVLMNPILLKPTTDVGSQVIVNGKVYGNMKATDYFRNKKTLVPKVMEAYRKLDATNDIIVIEGAGSPAELNLKQDDIVNMGMAKLAGAPVLLVGDIDRGGVFAQLIGTVQLLDPEEQQMVKGLVVNKFRGDKSLFDDGVKILEEKSGKRVAGVLPYIHVDIDDEDSLSDKLGMTNCGEVDIAVIRLPRISNFTDFDAFSQYEGVEVRYVRSAAELGTPDMILIPGTKSTISDMKWLRESGMETAIKKAAHQGCIIFGICGGYQMLGKGISDPDGAEGGGNIRGLELLDMETVFSGEKWQAQTKGSFSRVSGILSGLSGVEYEGYEIHMGQTATREGTFTVSEEGMVNGCQNGHVYGSYVHGIFDKREVSECVIRTLFERKGLEYTGEAFDRHAFKERQYDLLAEAVRCNIDMEYIYKVLRDGV